MAYESSEHIIEIDNPEILRRLFGECDESARIVEKITGVRMLADAAGVKLIGTREKVSQAGELIGRLAACAAHEETIDENRITYTWETVKAGDGGVLERAISELVCTTWSGKQIRCRTFGQAEYVKAIAKNDIVFGVGPAGTGKTYLAIAAAVNAFKQKKVSRIVLTRPAVEAGERLGFLPGDLQTKIDPYLRPVYDALYDIMGGETYQKLLEKGVIEVAPLAYMRGRTIEDAFIILDEAQNTTCEQMKMFLTRTGVGSKVIVNGDITQIDLPYGKKSGLVEASEVLRNVEGIAFVHFTQKDVVRHKLVRRIVEAYDAAHKRREREERERTEERDGN